MPHIDSYAFGMINIDGQSYSTDVKIFPERVTPGWWRKEGHVLYLEDIEDVVASSPDAIIVGTGASGAMEVPAHLRKKIQSLGIELTVLPTKQAATEHNRLSGIKQVVTCLHLTC